MLKTKVKKQPLFGASDSTIRLYNGSNSNGNTITLTVKEGYVIKSLKFVYHTSKTDGFISVNGTALTAVSATHTEDTFTCETATNSLVIPKFFYKTS